MSNLDLTGLQYIQAGEPHSYLIYNRPTQGLAAAVDAALSNYYTADQVDAIIGDINTILDDILGV